MHLRDRPTLKTKSTPNMNLSNAILFVVVILSAVAMDATGQTLDVNGGRELKSSKSSKSRRALDVDGGGDLEFDEVELDFDELEFEELLL